MLVIWPTPRVEDGCVGVAELPMIEHVEELRAELKFKLLCEIEVFEERRIDVRSTGTVEDIAAPEVSVIVPTISPLETWADSGNDRSKTRRMHDNILVVATRV
jgi:hypothetical protein